MHFTLFPLFHHAAKGAVAAHVAHQTGAASVGHAVGHVVAGHAVAVGAGAGTAAKVSSTGAIAKGLASGTAAKAATVHAAHGTVTAAGHLASASSPKAIVAVKHVAKRAIVRTAPFRPIVPHVPPVH